MAIRIELVDEAEDVRRTHEAEELDTAERIAESWRFGNSSYFYCDGSDPAVVRVVVDGEIYSELEF